MEAYNGRMTIFTVRRDPRVFDNAQFSLDQHGFLRIHQGGEIVAMFNADQIERIDFSPPR